MQLMAMKCRKYISRSLEFMTSFLGWRKSMRGCGRRERESLKCPHLGKEVQNVSSSSVNLALHGLSSGRMWRGFCRPSNTPPQFQVPLTSQLTHKWTNHMGVFWFLFSSPYQNSLAAVCQSGFQFPVICRTQITPATGEVKQPKSKCDFATSKGLEALVHLIEMQVV